MSESRPVVRAQARRVMAAPNPEPAYEPAPAPRPAPRPVQPSASRFAPAMNGGGEPIPTMSSARVPQSSRLSQKQSMFDGGRENFAPWGAKPLRLMGNGSPLDGNGSPEAVPSRTRMAQAAPTAQASPAQPPAPAPVSSTNSYPEVDKILERQASNRPFSQGEATALLQAVQSAVTRVTAPENANDPCIKSLAPADLSNATTLQNRLAQTVPTMKATDTFQATDSEMSGIEKVLECSSQLASQSSPWGTIGAIVVLGLAAAGIAWVLSKK